MFGNIIFSVLAFLVALGVLISIHEFGHFWVARKMDVKVLKFSIGFGKSIWSRRGKTDDTEFAIAAIPLGGFVRMLDEREGEVKPQELHRAFNRKSVWARIAIVLAGPMANFILAILVYWIVYLSGISGLAPLLGEIDDDSPAQQAGFVFEDRIISINGVSTPSWGDARIELLQHSLKQHDTIDVQVETQAGTTETRTLTIADSMLLDAETDAVQQLGINQWWPRVDPVIGGIQPGGAASEAGLLIGDRVIQVNEVPIATWRDFVVIVRENPAQELELELEREGQPARALLVPGEKAVDSGKIGFIGVWETQSAELLPKARVVVSYPPLEALTRAFSQTWAMSTLTLRMLWKLLVGEASLDNISGPISIAQYAGQSASVGIDHYLNFLALISISLGVLNLLPIPLLDGGHLLYYLIEILSGKPLSERIQIMGQQVGLVLLGSLMLLAFYNDIWRLVG
ncbi:MAG: RIP metalloprotease RseP [Gammaproteobacteria bacterium]|nr:RIP metalloprotease RseP [Gammaproteobacteria bacterium]